VTIEPSQARARVWAPLGLLLVLACGAWFFPDQFSQPRGAAFAPGGQQVVPRTVAPGDLGEQITPELAVDPNSNADAARAAAAVSATQVLDLVAERGRSAAPAPSATVSAAALQARVRDDPAAVQKQTAGQRLRLSGTLAAVESGEPGVVVLHLALADPAATVRVVASPALATSAASWVAPRAVALDCLSQGVMMGEWLLVDCRE